MPDVAAFAGAMSARGVARLFDSGCHPWKAITMHLLASAQPNLANSAAWIVTAPDLFRISNSRLQTIFFFFDRGEVTIRLVFKPDNMN